MTAAAVVATRLSLMTMPVVGVVVLTSTALSLPPDLAFAVLPLWAAGFVVAFVLGAASDVVQVLRWTRGRQTFVRACSRGHRFWRLVLAWRPGPS